MPLEKSAIYCRSAVYGGRQAMEMSASARLGQWSS